MTISATCRSGSLNLIRVGFESVRKRGSRQVRSSRNSVKSGIPGNFRSVHGLDSSKGERVIRNQANFRWRVATTRTAMRKEHKLKFPSTFYECAAAKYFRQVKKPDKRLKLFRVADSHVEWHARLLCACVSPHKFWKQHGSLGVWAFSSALPGATKIKKISF